MKTDLIQTGIPEEKQLVESFLKHHKIEGRILTGEDRLPP
jgi:hypothetical protein